MRSAAKPRMRKSPAKAAAPRARYAPRYHSYNDRWMPFAWVVPVIALTVCVSILLRSKATYPVTLTSARLVSYFEEVQRRPVGERIAFWSESLLKNPALLSTLG